MNLIEEFNKYKSMNLSLNMARGKPCFEQLDLSNNLLNSLSSNSSFISKDGFDVRNYGDLTGIEDAKVLLADLISVNYKDVIVWGNSSLNIMYNLISHAYSHGILGNTPWCKLDKVKFLCPVPGYDRHFSITEYFGIEMINIPMDNNGPDMDLVESLIKEDDSIKGIWCVPFYSNPSGITYSDEVVNRFAKLSPKAKDFRIYWDLAYCMHHFQDKHDNLANLFEEAKKYNNEDLIYEFVSTSKMTFPGSGISAVAASEANLKEIEKMMSLSTIGFDKVNMLRHVNFLKNRENVEKHMKLHGDILRPKFELVDKIFSEEISAIARWSRPKGGYFISLDVKGCAKEVIARCKECGLTLTPAGSSFPYHKDPNNSNIRIAPTFVSLKDLELACKILCLAIKIETKE